MLDNRIGNAIRMPHMGSDKVIYIGMSADLLHPGHLDVIDQACKIGGRIVVALLTDKALASYKRLPYMSRAQRKVVVENVKRVDEIEPQETMDYVPDLLKTKPDHVLHGDDWETDVQAETRRRIVGGMTQGGGYNLTRTSLYGFCTISPGPLSFVSARASCLLSFLFGIRSPKTTR